MNSLIFFLVTVLILSPTSATKQPPFACDLSNPLTKSFTFCNTSLPITQRVENLVSLLTLDEKISQLGNTVPPIPRLGIPQYEWWSESLHGISDVGPGILLNETIRSATSFPQVILTSASFDTHLWYRIGQAIGVEGRAVYNGGQANGLTFWAPNVNIFRDPRWGRGQETPGEDPMVVSKYSVSYVRGIQGDSFEGGKFGVENHLQVSACCKHFAAYDLDNWNGTTRYAFDAHVSLQDLADTYQPPFRSCIEEGKASGLMCAYNRVNGVPNCADFDLLTNTARGKWDFQGYITSDCDAVQVMFEDQKYAKTPEDVVADVLKAGMDVNCGTYLQEYTKSAFDQKKLSEIDINRALFNIFRMRMRLGLFNGNPLQQQPFGKFGSNSICSKEHRGLALEAARDGIVLLKNSNKILPLSKTKTRTLGVIGPNADVIGTLTGNYFGPPCKSITPLEALRSYVIDTFYHPGCDSVACTSLGSIEEATQLAKSVDQVILFMGLDQTQEKEEHDRVDLVLPGKQEALIKSVAKASRKPVVLVLLSGGPIDISFAKYHPNIGSIIWVGYPGEAGGLALVDIIFGKHNPGGRLPMTWYPQEFIEVPMTDMRMRADPSSGFPGRTYRFYNGKDIYKFGYGLSYSTYSYDFIKVNQKKLSIQTLVTRNHDQSILVSEMGTEYCDRLKFTATISVENLGEMAGKHPVLLFVRNLDVQNGKPLKQLVGFQTLKLDAGKRAELQFVLSPCEHFSRADKNGLMVLEEGSRFLVVGEKEYPISVILESISMN